MEWLTSASTLSWVTLVTNISNLSINLLILITTPIMRILKMARKLTDHPTNASAGAQHNVNAIVCELPATELEQLHQLPFSHSQGIFYL